MCLNSATLVFLVQH